MSGVSWSDDEIGTMRAMTAAECPLREIAARVGRSVPSVESKLRKLGLRWRRGQRGRPPKNGGIPRTRTAGKALAAARAAVTSPPIAPAALMDLADRGCRWPTDDGRFCGAETARRQSYCECHRRRVYGAA